VNADRLRTISYGEERPVDFGHTESAWSKNRRADFIRTDQ
jgi:peptidoglycan-associated lipoprotein